jgi:predicted GNAT family N-acyltransferase
VPGLSANDITVRPGGADEVIDLRHKILRGHLPRSAAEYDVDAWPATCHWVATAPDGRVVGCVTIFPAPLDQQTPDAWQLRGMAVADDVRNLRVGAKLLAAVDGFLLARSPPPALVWCNARVTAIGFYQRCGWRVVSDVYDVPGVGPHRKMIKPIGHSVR